MSVINDHVSNNVVRKILLGGIDIKRFNTEFDIVDVFLVFGIIGGILYFYILVKELFAFSIRNYFAWFFVVLFLLVGALAGHFYASGVNSLYVALFCYYLQKNELHLFKSLEIE